MKTLALLIWLLGATAFAQTPLTASGLATFGGAAASGGGGGGGSCDSVFDSTTKVYLKLGEASGTRVDSSGNGNDAADSGSTGNTTGIIGNGINFTGSTHLTIANNSTVQCGAQDYSFSFWVKFNSVSGYPVMISKGNETLFWLNSSSKFAFVTNGGGGGSGATLTSATTATTGTWYFVVFTFKNSNTEKTIYINGVSEATVNSAGGGFTSGTVDLFVGGYSGGGYQVNAVMDEVALFKKVLSPTEISSLYNAGAGCRSSSY